MAAPAHQATSAILEIQNGTADGTLTLPAHDTNDVFLMHVMRRNTTNTVLTPDGWSLIAGPWNSTAERHYLFGLRAASASETDPFLDWAATSGDWYALCTSWRGCATSVTPWEVVGGTQTGTGNDPTLTGITTLSDESLVVLTAGYGDNNAAATIAHAATDPSSFTTRYAESAIGADGAIWFADGSRATAGATGDITTSNLTVTAGDGWGIIVLALIPEPAGGGGGFQSAWVRNNYVLQ